MTRTTVAQARREDCIGKDILLHAWVRTRRDSKGGFSFLELNDGSCFGNVQVLANQDLPNYESEVKHLTTGCSVVVEGVVNKSPAKGQAPEVQARKIPLVGPAYAERYPMQKKGATLESLRPVPHLRPRTNTFGAVARL